MNRTIFQLLSITLLTFGTLGAYGEEDIIQKSFDLKPAGALVMDVDRGSIHVTTSDSDKVDVKIRRELKKVSAQKARDLFEQHKIDFSSTSDELRIQATNPQTFGGFRNPFSTMQVNYEISIPSRLNIDLKTRGGHIEVGNLEGKAAVSTAGGNLNIGAIKGPLNAHTSGGHIIVSKVEGDANVSTSGGNVHLGEISGDLVAHTSGGHITLDKTLGTVKASTSGGNIQMNNAANCVNAQTSGGHVSAHMTGQAAKDCCLKTSGGNIDLSLANDLRFNLAASTGGGRVASDFPGDFNKQKTKLSAQANGGGPEFVLQTSGGNITIQKD